MAADHFAPWVPAQGQSPFVWSVLAALGQRTSGDLGPGVASASRFHPAITAQAAATQEALYPGRTWLGLGAGEALNEHVFGAYWPEAGVRSAMLFEAVDVIEKLFAASIAGKDVKHSGEHYRMETTRLWTMPAAPPARAGRHRRADQREEDRGGTPTGSSPRPPRGRSWRCCWSASPPGPARPGRTPTRCPRCCRCTSPGRRPTQEAMRQRGRAVAQRGHGLPQGRRPLPPRLRRDGEALVRAEDFAGRMLISSDPDAHRAQLQGYLDLGFDRVYVHNVAREQGPWMEVFGREVLPALVR